MGKLAKLLLSITLVSGQLPLANVKPSVAQAGDPLAGSEWRPLAIGNVSIPANTALYVKFMSEGRFAGFAGCNDFSGFYRVAGETVSFSFLSTTETICPDTIVSLEGAFLDTLRSSATFERNRAVLALFNRDGGRTAQFAQTDWD